MKVLGLPIGEWLFFITVLYACLFIYEVVRPFFFRKVYRRDMKKTPRRGMFLGSAAVVLSVVFYVLLNFQ